MSDPKVQIKVDVDGKGATSALGAIGEKIRDLAGSIPGASSALGAMASVAGAAAAAFATLAKSVSEYATAERNVARLAAALGQVGRNTSETVDSFQELAGELQRTTAIADDEWIAVLTKLVQFGAKPESIGLHVEAVKNLAGVVGDLGTATSLYARALQGNYDAFGRYGIRVQEAATQTEKLTQLQEQLAQRGSGQLEAAAESLSGQFASLKLAVSDVFEAMGRGLARTGMLQFGLRALTVVAESVAESLGGPVEVIAGLANRMGEAAAANEAYKRTLEDIARVSEAVKAATEREVAAIRARQQAMDEISDSQMALDLAVVDDAQASGRISPKAGIAQRASIRKAYATKKYERQQQADLAEQARLEQDFADQRSMLATLEKRRRTLAATGTNSPLRNIAGDSRAAIADLQRERVVQEQNANFFAMLNRFVQPWARNLFPFEGQATGSWARVDEIDARIKELEALGARGPANIARRDEELTAVRTAEAEQRARADEARRRASQSGIPLRVRTREVTFGLDQTREGIKTGGELRTASDIATTPGAGQLTSAVTASSSAMVAAAQAANRAVQIVQSVQQDTERRLRAIEANAKNAANR